jgi:hypothetical protein
MYIEWLVWNVYTKPSLTLLGRQSEAEVHLSCTPVYAIMLENGDGHSEHRAPDELCSLR